MITANRGGHNYQATGANGYVNEVTEDRKINAAVIKYLKQLGHNSNDVTPGNCNSDSDLVYGVQMSNEVLDADLFNSNHLNAHVTCQEAKGCECVTYGDAASVTIGNRVTDNLVKLGFKRRPNKINKALYEVKATVAPSVIVEPFFVDSYTDVQLYYKVGADEIGKAIAYGLAGKEYSATPSVITDWVETPAVNDDRYNNKIAIVNRDDVSIRETPNGKLLTTLKKGDKVKVWREMSSNDYIEIYSPVAGCSSAYLYRSYVNLPKVEEEEIMEKVVLYLNDADLFMGGIALMQKNSCPLMKKSEFEAQKLKAKTIIYVGGGAGNRYDTFKDSAKKL